MLGATYPLTDSAKPREEVDYKEVYPDLEATDQILIYVQDTQPDAPAHRNGAPAHAAALKAPSFREVAGPRAAGPEISKTLAAYGYLDPARPRKHHHGALVRPHLDPDDSESTPADMACKRRRLVEYDMDEQDLLYIEQRNAEAAHTIKLTPEVFEILITELENEWNKLEVQIRSREASNNTLIHLGILTLDGTNGDKYGNDDGIVEGSYMEQKCAVCNDSDCDNSNAIVFCDGCNIAVHQECYGIAFIPEGQWLCRRCMINKNSRHERCVFCPSTTGAFKQLDSSLWGHVICALWITELYFANPVYMEPIEGIEQIPKNRWRLTCYICKQRVGACIQCQNKNCFQAYHVTCAKRSGLYMRLTKGIAGALANKGTLRTYCDRHGPAVAVGDVYDPARLADGIHRTRVYYRDLKILKERNDKLLRKQETDNRLNIFKWRTENDTPIAPLAFARRLQEKLVELKVMDRNVGTSVAIGDEEIGRRNHSAVKDLEIAPNTSKEKKRLEVAQISYDICKYWCLKRELKNGAPLVRRNNNMELSSIMYGTNTPEEIAGKLEFGRILVEDLDKVLALVRSVVERQDALLQRSEVKAAILDTVYYPVKIVALLFLGRYGLPQASAAFQPIYDRAQLYGFDSVASFSAEAVSACKRVLGDHRQKRPSAAAKLCKRVLRDLGHTDWGAIDRAIAHDCGASAHLNIPFVHTSGSETDFKTVNAYAELEREGLSEVGPMNQAQEKTLTELLQNG